MDFARRQVESEMFCCSNIFPYATVQVIEINTVSKLHLDLPFNYILLFSYVASTIFYYRASSKAILTNLHDC